MSNRLATRESSYKKQNKAGSDQKTFFVAWKNSRSYGLRQFGRIPPPDCSSCHDSSGIRIPEALGLFPVFPTSGSEGRREKLSVSAHAPTEISGM